MVFRVHKTENYTVMSNYHLQDKNLSLKAKGLLSLMLSLPSDWDYSAKGLAELSRDGEDAVKSGLKELEEHKYLKRTQIRLKGIISDWQYDIYETPLGDFPLLDNSVVENQSQLNTNKENTKEEINNSTNVELEQPTVTPNHNIKTRNRLVTATPVQGKKKSRYEQCADVIDEYTKDTELKRILLDYLSMRLAIKDKPMYVSGWKALMRKLFEMSQDVTELIKIVRQSLENSWATFYPLKRDFKKKDVFNEFGVVKSVPVNKEEILNEVF